MTVSDIVTQLKYGELRSVAIKDDIPAIVSYINLAVSVLYGRFKLSSGEQIVDLVDNVATYTLNDDVMIVEAVYKEDGEEYALNEDDNLLGVFTPTYNTIQVPNAATGNQISIIYLKDSVDLLIDVDDAITIAQSVLLPKQLIEPLLHYIGYRAHSSMNGDIKAENNTHYMRFEASVKRIKSLGLVRDDVVPAKVSLAEGFDNESN